MHISSPKTTAPAPASADGAPILSAAFWPAIDPADARVTMRLDGTVTAPRLRHALIAALAMVGQDLRAWRARQQAQGHAALDAVPAETLDGESLLVQHWRRAVYAWAAAELAERYRSADPTGAGRTRADDLNVTADELRADARTSIRALLGVGRDTVELI